MAKPIAVGAYLFAGGFALGVNKSFNTVATFQDDNYGVPTFEENFPNTVVNRYKEDWNDAINAPALDKVDFLYANPPCAIFSSAGVTKKTGGWREDPRTDCWRNTLGLVDAIQPTVFAIESVQQAMTRGREFIQEVTDDFLKKGYSITWVKTNSARMGVPQIRKRFFLVGHKVRINWAVPNRAPVTVREAFKQVKDPGRIFERPSYQRYLRFVKYGDPAQTRWDRLHEGKKLEHDKMGRIVGRPPRLLRRIRWDEPSPVVMADMQIHPGENRFLGENEAKALMGFPQGFQLVGGEYSKLLTRGVCPPVGAWLARNVRRAIEANVKQRTIFDMEDFS